MESPDFVERVARGNRVNKKEALSRPHVLLAHCPAPPTSHQYNRMRRWEERRKNARVFLLSSGIQYVQQRNLLIDHALLAVRVSAGRRGREGREEKSESL